MNTQVFDAIVKNRLVQIEKVLGNKAKEYALDGDRLHNFKIAARMQGQTQAEALWGMAMKHLVSVDDLVKGRLVPTSLLVHEKLGDMINYLILLEAVFAERITQ